MEQLNKTKIIQYIFLDKSNTRETVFSAVPLESETVSQLVRRGIAVQTSNPTVEGQLYTSSTKQILHGHFLVVVYPETYAKMIQDA